MNEIKTTVLETIGSTPIVEISSRLNKGDARVLAKIESFNPGGSAKDRVAIAMIEEAEKEGILKPGGTIIEPTSGNTGIGLALVCAVKGYHLILTMPETMSVERRRLASAYGAEIVLTPGAKGMTGSIEKARELAKEKNGFIPMQFENKANPNIHARTTAVEIWSATSGDVDVFVSGVGTGGTISGVGKFLKSKNPSVEIVAVEPNASPVLSGGAPHPHGIQGIGAGFVPKNYDSSVVDKIIPTSLEDAITAARAAASTQGLLVGISSGAALFVALELAKKEEYKNKTIVVLLPDTGERYLSTCLFEE